MRNETIKFNLIDDETGDEVEHELPAIMAVCGCCDGHGTILNPNIGEHAYSMEEFDEAFPEDEDKEQYCKRGGIYDITCPVCGGKNVVPVVDEDACERDPKLAALLERFQDLEEDNAQYEAECRAERRMEMGY